MAIVQNPITGRSSGKFGNAVFSTQFGLNVLKSKALTVHNPNTPGQQDQRSKMRVLVAYGRAVLPAIRIGFKQGAPHMSAWNRFIKDNMSKVITMGGGIWQLDDTDMPVLSKGTLPGLGGFAYSRATGAISWTDHGDGVTSLGTDKILAVTIDSTTGLPVVSSDRSTRSLNAFTPTFSNGAGGANNTEPVFVIVYRESEGLSSDMQADY